MSLPHIVVGHGPDTVVVLAGGNAFVSRFDAARAAREARRLARLFPRGTRLCVVAYDPGAHETVTVPHLAGEVADLLRTAYPGAVLAGVSFGGLVALRVAADHPDAVSRLVLLASAHRFSNEGRLRVAAQLRALRDGDLDAMIQPFLRLCWRWWWNALLSARVRVRRSHLLAHVNDPRIVVAMLQAALEESDALTPRLASIRLPTFIVGGTADQFFGDGAMRTLARTLPAATLLLVADETHMLPLERPDLVAAPLADFLGRSRPD